MWLAGWSAWLFKNSQIMEGGRNDAVPQNLWCDVGRF